MLNIQTNYECHYENPDAPLGHSFVAARTAEMGFPEKQIEALQIMEVFISTSWSGDGRQWIFTKPSHGVFMGKTPAWIAFYEDLRKQTGSRDRRTAQSFQRCKDTMDAWFNVMVACTLRYYEKGIKFKALGPLVFRFPEDFDPITLNADQVFIRRAVEWDRLDPSQPETSDARDTYGKAVKATLIKSLPVAPANGDGVCGAHPKLPRWFNTGDLFGAGELSVTTWT